MMMRRMDVVVTVMGRWKILSFILICILLIVGLILVSDMMVVMRMMMMKVVVMSGSRSCDFLLWFISFQLTCG